MQAGAVGGQKQALGPLELKLQVSACKQSDLAEPPGQPLDWNPDPFPQPPKCWNYRRHPQGTFCVLWISGKDFHLTFPMLRTKLY